MSENTKLAIFYAGVIILLTILQAFVDSYSKRGYIFGVRMSSSLSESKKAKEIIKNYKMQIILLGISLAIFVVLISYAIDNFAVLNIIYFLAIILLYLPLIVANKKLKGLAKMEKMDKKKIVSIEYSKNKIFNKKELYTLYLGLLALVIMLAIKIHLDYEGYPDTLIMQMNMDGEVSKVAEKTYFDVQSPSLISLVMLALTFFSNISIVLSKKRISPDMPEESLANVLKTRRIWTYYCAMLAFLLIILFQVGISSFMKSGDTSLVKILAIITIVLSIGGGIIIGKLRSVDGSALNKTKNYGYEEEDDRWILGGSIYYNPDDPALFVEKRIGVGTTINVGNKWGKIFMALGLGIPLTVLIVDLVFS